MDLYKKASLEEKNDVVEYLGMEHIRSNWMRGIFSHSSLPDLIG